MKEKKGKKLTLSSIKKRFLLNYPQKLFLFPTIRKISPYTMLSYSALCEMYDVIHKVDTWKVPGAIVEMGCWSGGCGALMSWTTKKNKSDRDIWLFDSFEGLPELAEEDREWAEKSNLKMKSKEQKEMKPIGSYATTEQNVQFALESLSAKEKVHVVKGWFQNSVPGVQKEIGPIAVLRLDGDLYESTKYCLGTLYDQVSSKGIIVIDDYHLEGCRRALYEFFYTRNISPNIVNNSFIGGRVYFVKE
jgi:O-methyltransferase